MSARFLVSGDSAVVVEFGNRVDRIVSEQVLALSARVRSAAIDGVLETVPTYRSLMVLHDPLAIDTATLIARLDSLLGASDAGATEARLWRLPACYDEAYAPDLADIAQRTGMTRAEVVRLHSEQTYHVYMLGFSPGFTYMGDLPQPLVLPRRTDPRVKVPAGSIAIATGQTAIYPVESPGGWHLIGTTPVRLFDAQRQEPALLRPGDKVKFEPISALQFEKIRASVIPPEAGIQNNVVPAHGAIHNDGFEVISAGPFTTVQDAGRSGYQDVGVPRSGPLDRVSYALANALVGNGANAPCLEMLLQGVTLKVLADSVRVALVGCGAGIEIKGENARRVPAGQSVRLARGEVLRVGALGDSVCAYLAIEGGIEVPAVLGSASTYVRGAIGGVQGRRLQPKDRLLIARSSVDRRPERALAEPLELGFDEPIRVVLGPQHDYFTAAAIETFLSSEYTVTPHADRMGYRLEGPQIGHQSGYDIVSDGIVTGAVQVPGSRQPIVLMVDNQTTGGYPKIATVISADIPLVARRRPGRKLRFVQVDVAEAGRARRAQEAALRHHIEAIRTID
ncbi:MAG TPA: 5-oxoprolinase subunit PxpB [Burkholderiales bacterium]|nr:5-oxoprolinase subunit PxpB [Burkholderiales bacterium]